MTGLGRWLRRTALTLVIVTIWGMLPEAGLAAKQGGIASFDDSTVLVAYQPGTSEAARVRIERREKAVTSRMVGTGTHVLRVGKGRVAGTVAALKRHSAVRYAEPNYALRSAEYVPNDPLYSDLWAMAAVKADKAWELTTGSADVVVAVLDTGIDYDHPDLTDNVWTNSGDIGGCGAGTHGYNVIAQTCDPMDDNLHGTHLAGTIGAVGNNGTGVVGLNWSTRIMGIKFLDARGAGTTADAIAAIDFAVQAKQAGVNVAVLNASWGGAGFSQALLDQINVAGANGILFVAAAGNDAGDVEATPVYPCAYSTVAGNVICVAASDQADNLASFSNFGSSSVNLAAPGVSIVSLEPNGAYGTRSGTSMATPHVTGAAALLLANNGELTVSDLKEAILANVDAMPGLEGKTSSAGRLNVCRALGECSPPEPTVPAAPHLGGRAGNATVRLAWSSPSAGGSDITGYQVYRGTASEEETLLATVGAENVYDDSSVTNGQTYYYRVRAVNAVGESELSNELALTPRSLAPAPPRGLKAARSRAAGSAVALRWTTPVATRGADAVTGYNVYRGTSPGTLSLLEAIGNVTSYQDGTTQQATRYYYRVTAVNGAESRMSNLATAVAR